MTALLCGCGDGGHLGEVEAIDVYVVWTEPVLEAPVCNLHVTELLSGGLDRRWQRILGVFEHHLARSQGRSALPCWKPADRHAARRTAAPNGDHVQGVAASSRGKFDI